MINTLQNWAGRIRRFVDHPRSDSPDTEYNQPGTPVWQRTGFMHRQRYAFAAAQVAGKRVLNVACGPGYAEEILATGRPTSVVAVDYDRELIERLGQHRARAPLQTPVQYRGPTPRTFRDLWAHST